MLSDFDPGALLASSYPLPRGPRVCLRLVRPRDRDGVRHLFELHGLEPDELELARLTRFDPRRRLIICATALIGSAETILGVGAIELGEDAAGPGTGPDLVLVDEALTEGLDELISGALAGRVQTLAGGRAGAPERGRAA